MDSGSLFQPQLITFAAASRQTPRRFRSSLVKVKLAKKIVPSKGTRIVRVKSALRSPKRRQRNTIGAYEAIPKTSNEERNRSANWVQSRQILEDDDAPAVPIYSKTTSKTPAEIHRPGVRKDMDNMISGIAPAVLLGQCFSLLGVSNATYQHGREPYFRWLSFRMLFSAVVSFLLVLFALLELSFYIQTNSMTTVAYQTAFYYLNCFLASCLFVRLGRRWASLCAKFHNLENRLKVYGNPNGLRRRMRIITAAILILALVGHSVAQAYTFIALRSNVYNSSQEELLGRYLEVEFKQLSFHFRLSPLVIFVAFLVNLSATFILSFNDLFIMLMSVAISSKFQLLNDTLVATDHKVKHVKRWRHLRETFNAISCLTQTVDDSLSLHVLLSFVNNFFCICTQLLHTVRYKSYTTYESFHAAVSLILLAVRMVSVLLFGASIPEGSRTIKRVLFSVTSEDYSVEVERLIHHVSSDDIALTGCNFFSISRSFLLTVIGTIVTYEIVLVQFNSLGSN